MGCRQEMPHLGHVSILGIGEEGLVTGTGIYSGLNHCMSAHCGWQKGGKKLHDRANAAAAHS